jgi:hypothetical protein
VSEVEDTDMTQDEFHAASAAGVPVVVRNFMAKPERVLTSEQHAALTTDLRGPRCNLCSHQIHRLGMDWVCTENCRCIMIGCIPKRDQ